MQRRAALARLGHAWAAAGAAGAAGGRCLLASTSSAALATPSPGGSSSSISKAAARAGLLFSRPRTVWAFGDGTSGVLGDGPGRLDAAPVLEPQPVAGLPDDVACLAAGAYHNLAITATGKLWTWGRNAEGQLGHSHVAPAAALGDPPPPPGAVTRGQQSVAAPGEVVGGWAADGRGGRVVAAAASGVASFAVDAIGGLWAWGSSKRGQLGLGRDVEISALPQVAAGWGHALALTADGELYGWGYNADARLGVVCATAGAGAAAAAASVPAPGVPAHRDASKAVVFAAHAAVEAAVQNEREVLAELVQWVPQRVLPGTRVVAIACGMDHSVALSDEGAVYAFGSGYSAPAAPLCKVEGELNAETDRAVQVAAGIAHTVLRTSAGRVLTFGSNSDGQLGREGAEATAAVVTELGDESIQGVAAGRVHTMALSEAGELWAWGAGRGGRLGNGCNQEEHAPVLADTMDMDGVRMLQVECGHDYTLVLCEDE